MKLRDFSDSLNGTIIGNPDLDITGVSGIADARTGDITFISSPKFLKYAAGTSASCIIVKDPIKDSSITQLQVDNPQYAFAKALEIFYPFPGFKPGTSPAASVAETASLGRDVHIAAFACISDQASIGDGSVILPGVFIGRNTTIGSRCMIYPNVVIGNNVRIGDRVIIHAGTVIGSDGFGYVLEKGLHYKIPQAGGVIIGDDVEIGSNVSIDRATLGNTKIGKGTKIDNLTQIAHNVTIGENSLIVSQVGIAGSSDIGSYVILGGQVGVADHTSVESGTMVAARSGLMGEVKKGIYGGAPAMPHKTWLRAHALFAKLPEMQKKIRELEEKIQALEKEANKE